MIEQDLGVPSSYDWLDGLDSEVDVGSVADRRVTITAEVPPLPPIGPVDYLKEAETALKDTSWEKAISACMSGLGRGLAPSQRERLTKYLYAAYIGQYKTHIKTTQSSPADINSWFDNLTGKVRAALVPNNFRFGHDHSVAVNRAKATATQMRKIIAAARETDLWDVYKTMLVHILEPKLFSQETSQKTVGFQIRGAEVRARKKDTQRSVVVNAHGFVSSLINYQIHSDGTVTNFSIEAYEAVSNNRSKFRVIDDRLPSFQVAVLSFMFNAVEMIETEGERIHEVYAEEAFLVNNLPALFSDYERGKIFTQPAAHHPDTIKSDYQVRYTTDFATLKPALEIKQRERIALPTNDKIQLPSGPIAYLIQETPEVYTFKMDGQSFTFSLLELRRRKPFIKTSEYYQALVVVATVAEVLQSRKNGRLS